MRFTAQEAAQIFADLDGLVKRGDSAAVLLCNWLRDHQGEAIHIYPESFVVEWKERNPLVQP